MTENYNMVKKSRFGVQSQNQNNKIKVNSSFYCNMNLRAESSLTDQVKERILKAISKAGENNGNMFSLS
jgi:hypothetical protein